MNVLFINVVISFHNLTTKDVKNVNQILDERKRFITRIVHGGSSEDRVSIEFTGLVADLFSLIHALNKLSYITELRNIDKTKPMELIIKRD